MPDAKRPLKAFLSYAHSDQLPVRILYNRLLKDGVEVWFDKERLLPGQDWEYEIRKAAREADVVLVCLSKQFNQAGYRQREVRWALDAAMEQPEGEIFLIPVRLEECDTLESLRKWHWVDLFENDGYRRLLRALRIRTDRIGATLRTTDKLPIAQKENGTPQIESENEKEIFIQSSEVEQKSTKSSRRLNTAIIVALIGLVGTIAAALINSPLFESMFSRTPVATMTSPSDYDELYGQALNARAQAVSETDAARQRDAWQRVLNSLNKADEYRVSDESKMLRNEAQSNLDSLMGILRLEFMPAFPNGVGGSSSTVISRMAASESDLYMLTAPEGKILHASFTGRNLQLDNAFNCQPGNYAGYQVGTLIDILALPKVNALGATVLGIDGNGNLLYCAPDQVPQAIPLPSLPNTNWGKITAFALDNDNLYVLDAQSRAVWVFPGQSSSFIDTPYFYFGNEIPVSIDSAIDLAVSSDDLYMLHEDGHLSTCTFSRISDAPTRCQDPAPRVDNYPAHRDIDFLGQAQFAQIAITSPPNSVILLLDSPNQSVFRFSPRSFEFQSQVTGYAGKDNPFPRGAAQAMAVGPDYVLYLAVGDQIYFATNTP